MIPPRDLDAVPGPAHQGRADAHVCPAFSGDQSRSCAVGAAGHPLVRARLYRRPRPRLAADSTIVANDRYWAGAKRPSPESVDDLLVYCAFGVIIGGRLGNVLFYDPHYYFAHPLDIFKVWEGGMAFHGGLIGAFLGILLFARRYHAPALTVLDLCSLVAPIGLFFGRIANFIRPELWGRPTDVPGRWCFRGPTACRAIRARSTRRFSRACSPSRCSSCLPGAAR